MTRLSNFRLAAHLVAAGAWAYSSGASALEISPGDYEPLPAGTHAWLLYYQHAQSSAFYRDGQRSSDFRLRSDVSLLRYIHSIALGDKTVIEPQFILPYGHLHAGGDASGLGQTTGSGDLILGAPIKWSLATANADVFSLGPYVYLPTGSYQRDDSLNLGENRWRLLLQAAYVHHFNERWALDSAADVSWFSRNDDFGAGGTAQKQQARYEYQAYLRYSMLPGTQVGLGGGHIHGARSSVDGTRQDDALSSTYVRLSLTHWLTPSVQVQAVLGRDLDVEQGFKENARLNLRLAKLF